MGEREHRERTRKYDIKCTQTGGDCSFIPPKEPPKTDVDSLKVTERLGVINMLVIQASGRLRRENCQDLEASLA